MEHIFTLFFVTFSAAFIGVVPPGMLNLTSLKIRLEKGSKNSYMFTLGVAIVIAIQSFLGVQISKYLYNHPEVIDLLMKIAVVIFFILSIYFLISAKKKRDDREKIVSDKKRNDFYKGLLLASLNMLAVPYYSGINAMFRSQNLIDFNPIDTTTFILASSAGTSSVLLIYARYLKNIKIEKNRFGKGINYLLSGLMFSLVIITLIRLFYR